MNCQKCGGKTEVVETQKYSMFVWRKRRCLSCQEFAHTHENFVETAQRSRVVERPDRPKVVREAPASKRVLVKKERPVPPVVAISARKKIEEIMERWRLEEELMDRASEP